MVEVRLLLGAWRWPDGGMLMGPGLSVVCIAYSGSPAPFPSGLGHFAVPAQALAMSGPTMGSSLPRPPSQV